MRNQISIGGLGQKWVGADDAGRLEQPGRGSAQVPRDAAERANERHAQPKRGYLLFVP
jgi:hypothetical protein